MTFHHHTGLRAEAAFMPTRRTIEDEIERLITLLDDADGDTDTEPNGDELDASWPVTSCRKGAAHEDDEDSNDLEHDTADLEPDLGWTDNPDQAQLWWSQSDGVMGGDADGSIAGGGEQVAS